MVDPTSPDDPASQSDLHAASSRIHQDRAPRHSRISAFLRWACQIVASEPLWPDERSEVDHALVRMEVGHLIDIPMPMRVRS